MEHQLPESDAQLLRGLAKEAGAGKPAAIVEVGSYVGLSALIMAGDGHRVYCVDHWLGPEDVNDRLGEVSHRLRKLHGDDILLATFLENTKLLLFKSIFPCRGPSQFWAKHWPFQVDMVFLDADHRYREFKADVEAWLPHVRTGGIMCGHDLSAFEGVVKSVNEIFGDNYDSDAAGSIWWAKK